MPWNEAYYPRSMRNLPPKVRLKAIEIANAKEWAEARQMAVVALITAQMLMKPEQTGHAPGIKLTPQANLAGVSRRRIQFKPGVARGYLITRSALASTLGGMVRPICLAVLRLMTNSNFVACCTDRSAGFVPLRILST